MKSICLYFQVHQPYRLRRYRFFDIGNDSYYYNDYENRTILRRVALECYLPTNKLLLEQIQKYGSQFKVSFSISGCALEQFKNYAPEVLESFQELARTGCVEFLSETFSHSLVALKNKDEFEAQVEKHRSLIKEYFGQEPTVFRNTELVYSDAIGEMVYDMGYKGMITEGAKHILGWKSPNYLYYNARNPKLKLLLKNYKLSDDIAFRFSDRGWPEWPLTTDKFVGWLNALPPEEEIVNLFMDYETFGEHQREDSGIFDFMKAFPEAVISKSGYQFVTPSEAVDKFQPIAAMNVEFPISWADEERDLSAWLGNEMQDEAFEKLYELKELADQCKMNADLQADWQRLQTSDHFYYMCTKFFSDGNVHQYFNPYSSPYDAFINYMNVLSDFKLRLEQESPEVAASKIAEYEKELERLREKLGSLSPEEEEEELSKPVATTKRTTAKTKNTKSKTTKAAAKKKKLSEA